MLRKLVTLSGVGLASWSPVLAQTGSVPPSGTSEQLSHYLLVLIFGIVVFFLLLIILIMFQLTYLWMPKKVASEVVAEPLSLWEKVAGLKPLAQEKSLLMEEDFDGISELNNPVPGWFNALFYGTIATGIVYLLVFHVWKVADLQDVEFAKETQLAEAQKEAYLKTVASSIDENSVKLVTQVEELAKGKEIYLSNCAACHGQAGEGTVGPNLTDEYWLHGGNVGEVFKTIKYGVQEKGMIAWDKKLNPLQMQQVIGYIFSLKGTKPANGKAPQGEKVSTDKLSMNK